MSHHSSSLQSDAVVAAGGLRYRPLQIGPLVVDPPILQAPMAGFTNYAFRQIVREYGGVGLQATEMVSARSVQWRHQRGVEHPDRLWGVKEEPRPLAVQIWDNDPWMLAQVAERLVQELHVSVVDINFGCPVKQVTQRAQSGSYLLRDPGRMASIIQRVVKACAPTPVTAKIRLGCTRDRITVMEVARAVEEAGAAALTVHGRTAQDFFRGSADWDRIAQVKSCLRRMPLIGNGDLDSPQRVLEAFQRYGVDGVMIARAALGRPWLFRQVHAALAGQPIPADPTLQEQRQCLLRHYECVVGRFGTEKGTMLMASTPAPTPRAARGLASFAPTPPRSAARPSFARWSSAIFHTTMRTTRRKEALANSEDAIGESLAALEDPCLVEPVRP